MSIRLISIPSSFALILSFSVCSNAEIFTRRNKPRVSESEAPDVQTTSPSNRTQLTTSDPINTGDDIPALILMKRSLEDQLTGKPTQEQKDRYEQIVAKLIHWSDMTIAAHTSSLQAALRSETVIHVKSRILVDSNFGSKIDPLAWSTLLLSADKRYQELNAVQVSGDERRTLIRRVNALSNESERIRALIDSAQLQDDFNAIDDRLETFKAEILILSLPLDSDLQVSPSIDELSLLLTLKIEEQRQIKIEALHSLQRDAFQRIVLSYSAISTTLQSVELPNIPAVHLIQSQTITLLPQSSHSILSIVQLARTELTSLSRGAFAMPIDVSSYLCKSQRLLLDVVDAIRSSSSESVADAIEPAAIADHTQDQPNYTLIIDSILLSKTIDEIDPLLTELENSITDDMSTNIHKAVIAIRDIQRIDSENRFESWDRY